MDKILEQYQNRLIQLIESGILLMIFLNRISIIVKEIYKQ